ncbi:metallophosphoesterase [Mucilaginibacter sp. HD30]
MSLIFVHLSDIHFGQEKLGGDMVVHDDIKEELLADAHDYIANSIPAKKADGVIISGDIAYAGKPSEYETAGQWLDRLTSAVGCEVTAVQLVPGNHDIDRDKITAITQQIIDDIIKNGDNALDKYLDNEDDREFLYKQFIGYRKFAEGYDCPLDNEGRISKHRVMEIAPGRRIKFLGMNTALICSKSKAEYGGLILGKRQRVIRTEPGLETIVIAHHPMNWLQDSDDALRYIRNRARVFISGHEHAPAHKCENVDAETDLLMLASGAAVPPGNEPGFNYCYNVLEFSWLEQQDALVLKIHGRTWDDEHKRFTGDTAHFKDNGTVTYVLKSPNFKKLPLENIVESEKEQTVIETSTMEFAVTDLKGGVLEEKEFHLVLLKFFRDLSSAQRLAVLVELGAIPKEWSGSLTHSLERNAFDKLVQNGKLQEIHNFINQLNQTK